MRRIKTVVLVLALFSISTYAQKFQTTIKADGNVVSIYLRPDATGSISFSDLEFYLRYPSSQNLSFSNFQSNPAAFPGIVFNDNLLTPAEREAGYNSIKFGFIPPGTPTTTTSYTAGQEYRFCSITVTGTGATASLQLVHNADFMPYYVAITKENPTEDAAPTDPANYFYPTTSSDVSGGNDLYFYSLAVALSVNLLEFKAEKQNQSAYLTWKTAEENHFSHFDIEKSSNGKKWETIGQVKGGYPVGYYLNDDKAFAVSKTVFYRLKMVDLDGKFTYSPVRELEADKATQLKLYPNPANDRVTIEGLEKGENYYLTDALGKILAQYTQQKTLNVSHLTEGVYFIRTASGQVTSFSVIR
jgi:Secretion system C-terminal sorting domain